MRPRSLLQTELAESNIVPAESEPTARGNFRQVRLPVEVALAVILSRRIGDVHHEAPRRAVVGALPNRHALHPALFERDEHAPVPGCIGLMLEPHKRHVRFAVGQFLADHLGRLIWALRRSSGREREQDRDRGGAEFEDSRLPVHGFLLLDNNPV